MLRDHHPDFAKIVDSVHKTIFRRSVDHAHNILVGVVLNFLETSKCAFGTQTMPITRSKQLVEPM